MSDWRRHIVSPTEIGEPISAKDRIMSINFGSTSTRGDLEPVPFGNNLSLLIRDKHALCVKLNLSSSFIFFFTLLKMERYVPFLVRYFLLQPRLFCSLQKNNSVILCLALSCNTCFLWRTALEVPFFRPKGIRVST